MGVTVVLGEMDVARAKPKPGHEVSYQCEKHLERYVPDAFRPRCSSRCGGRLLSGGQPEVAAVPVDDVQQARSA